jgi:thiol-disulfide isomerase/thioredoxin
MKRTFISIFISITSISACAQQSSNATSTAIPKLKIDELVKMIDTSSQPLIINFWATWCKPCTHEIPWFEETVAEFKDKNVKLILVSLDFKEDYPNKLKQFVAKQKYQSQVVWLNETNADVFCPQIDSLWGGSIPSTLMINKKKNYRQFFEHQIKEERFRLEVQKLVE